MKRQVMRAIVMVAVVVIGVCQPHSACAQQQQVICPKLLMNYYGNAVWRCDVHAKSGTTVSCGTATSTLVWDANRQYGTCVGTSGSGGCYTLGEVAPPSAPDPEEHVAKFRLKKVKKRDASWAEFDLPRDANEHVEEWPKYDLAGNVVKVASATDPTQVAYYRVFKLKLQTTAVKNHEEYIGFEVEEDASAPTLPPSAIEPALDIDHNAIDGLYKLTWEGKTYLVRVKFNPPTS